MFSLIFFISLISLSLSHSADEWRSRSIYQLLTDRFARTDENKNNHECTDLNRYCGGTFTGLKNNLDYIQNLGFNAIWISPIFENLGDQGYHGYWTTNYYSINQKFGTPEELLELIQECHSRDIWVMVDVVLNHVAPVGNNIEMIHPFNKEEHYHSKCDIHNWDNPYELHNCRLWDLPDLNHENPVVVKSLVEWGRFLVEEYKVDGLRLDAIGHMPQSFLREFAPAVGVFTLGEVLHSNWHYISAYQGSVDGILNYPLYYVLRDVFREGHEMWKLEKYFQEDAKMWKDPTLLGNFIGNHDVNRFLEKIHGNQKLKAAMGMVMTVVGIPILYYGDEQGFSGSPLYEGKYESSRESLWQSMDVEHDIYAFLRKLTHFRAETEFYKLEQIQRYCDGEFYAFTRGEHFFAFTNSRRSVRKIITYHPYLEGTLLCNLFNPEDCVKVHGGSFEIHLNDHEVKIYSPKHTKPEKQNVNLVEKIKIKENHVIMNFEDFQKILKNIPIDLLGKANPFGGSKF